MSNRKEKKINETPMEISKGKEPEQLLQKREQIAIDNVPQRSPRAMRAAQRLSTGPLTETKPVESDTVPTIIEKSITTMREDGRGIDSSQSNESLSSQYLKSKARLQQPQETQATIGSLFFDSSTKTIALLI